MCVIGGGPAGLAAAIALRMMGSAVVLLEANVPPIDKACGEGLMPDTLRGLDELGVEVPVAEGAFFQGVALVRGSQRVAADFATGPALGLRRTVLHRVLVERAKALGVELRWGVKGIRVTGRLVEAGGLRLRPGLVVGADGQNSAVRRALGLTKERLGRKRFGFRQHYAVAPWCRQMELHWGPGCQLYITPVASDEIGIALLTSDPKQRLSEALPLFPELAKRLRQAEAVSPEMGALVTTRKVTRVGVAGAVLVGDASGSVDAITGEGIGLAVRQALALARAYRSGDLERYQKAHRQIRRRPAAMASLMLSLARFEPLQRRAMATLSAEPGLFGALLALHVGEGSGAEFLRWRTCQAGLKFLLA